jgi:hypothetical protein
VNYYLSNNVDVDRVFEGNAYEAIKHYLIYGIKEGRSGVPIPNTFAAPVDVPGYTGNALLDARIFNLEFYKAKYAGELP